MKRIQRVVLVLLALSLLCGALTATAAAADTAYTDVPSGSWAAEYIEKARELGLMNGVGSGRFGYGSTVTNAQFAQMLCNILGWELTTPAQATFSDVQPGSWYYAAVETAYANGAFSAAATFRPDTPITRSAMAEAFVRALGLESAAELEETQPSLFTDVTGDHGYINVAKHIGLLQGKSAMAFDPDATAKREEAATLLVRFYESYCGETEFVHGFYAISSYAQRDLAARMDAVTYMWSTVKSDGTLDMENGTYALPDSYESIVEYLDAADVKQHLGVYMDASGGVEALLLDETARSGAVTAILAELDRTYEAVGKNPYSGVTIDLEGLQGEAVKAAFNAFLTELSQGLIQRGKTLYVAVQPALSTGAYFDGYDYRTIGRLADKVILMAHDYAPTDLSSFLGTSWQQNAALTPIDQVYYSLCAVTDAATGVEDPGKLVLAISIDAVAWKIDQAGKLLSGQPVSVSISRVAQVLPTAQAGYSAYSQNPYLIYEADDGDRLFLWYEDARSVEAKLALARCFGITGVSVWRLGNIPDTAEYDLTAALLS